MTEVWQQITGAALGYEVSDLGRARSPNGLLKAFLHPNKRFYPKVNIKRADGKHVIVQLHHVVLKTFVGPRPPGALALHADDVKANCALSNLRWGTPQENIADRQRNGIYKRGAAHHSAKLTEKQALEILAQAATGFSQREIARRYGISQTAVYSLLKGRSWPDLDRGAA